MKNKAKIAKRQSIALLIVMIIMTSSFLISCKKETVKIEKNLKVFHEFSRIDTLSLKNMFEFMGSAQQMHLIDSTMIIWNPQAKDYKFYNLSLNKNKISNKFLPLGRGPGETLGVFGFGIQGNMFWVYDIVLKKILTKNITSILKNDRSIPFKEYPLEGRFYKINFVDSLHLIANGDIDSPLKLQKIDLVSSKKISEFGIFKNVKDDYDISSIKKAYESFPFSKPTGNKVVLAYRYIDEVEIFDVDKQTSHITRGPGDFELDPKIFQTGGRTINTIHTFVTGTVTDKYIYLLYSGKIDTEVNPHHGNSIYVYDWEGNPIKKMILKKEILSIVVSADDTLLYAFDPNTGYILKAVI